MMRTGTVSALTAGNYSVVVGGGAGVVILRYALPAS